MEDNVEKVDKKRLSISITKDTHNKLEKVYSKYGISKSVQIETLILKYLEKEYGVL